MRNEEEMFQLIINTAKKDVRIRAAYLEGSRANPEVKKELFLYSIQYTETVLLLNFRIFSTFRT